MGTISYDGLSGKLRPGVVWHLDYVYAKLKLGVHGMEQ